MRRATMAMAAAFVIAWTGSLRGAETSRADIEAGIERGVKMIVSKQTDNGSWPMDGKGVKGYFDVGHTALAVLALQHSGSKSAEAQLSIKKGLAYILSHPPEPATYTAGLVEQALFMDSPATNARPIGVYAWMLIGGQKPTGISTGTWSYELPKPPSNWQTTGLGPYAAPVADWWFDHSNGQFAILGLVYASRAGYQVPRVVWERAAMHYTQAQHKDGGWDYQSAALRDERKQDQKGWDSGMNMTLAGTVSTYMCEEMLADKRHGQCKATPPNPVHEAGLKWIGNSWKRIKNGGAYGWYGAERLGLLIGYSEFGGNDWYQDGVPEMLALAGQDTKGDSSKAQYGAVIDNSFAVLFLARGRNPIIINKLKREGDWNLHRYDMSNLIDHISGPWQTPCQWRIVTLGAKMEQLLKVPMLWISGHEAVKFTPEEKAKLKEYVEKGGTILAEDCCSSKPFDTSFRALLKEEWPDNALVDLPKTHPIFTSFRKLGEHAELMGMPMSGGQGRLGVIYIPHGISCRWEVGGSGARADLDLGACIYLYVDKTGKRLKAEAAEAAEAAKPATPAAPVMPATPEAPVAPAPPAAPDAPAAPAPEPAPGPGPAAPEKPADGQ